jgi:predicted DNA-binding transcriptional regulator AlpA
VYVWEDPRDADELPRWVGYGPWPTPWQALWDFRQHGRGPLFDWLRELDANGLQPKVSSYWALGQWPKCLDGVAARRIAHEFIMRISRMANGGGGNGPRYPPHPEFLLNPHLGPPDPRKPIVAERPDGQTMEFLSVGHAAECGYTRSAIYRALDDGGTHRGLRWRYAAGLKRGRIRRPVERVTADGKATAYASLYAAAKATGLSRPTIARMIETGQPDGKERRWRLAGG